MIKGKTTIELTDVNTGKVERFEDENILTNAIELYINLAAAWCSKNSSTAFGNQGKIIPKFPISDGIIGGIKLFQNTIEENANNYVMPNIGTNPAVGYASYDASDGSDTMRGSRNISETTELENGMQIVWDFATSEANGTISCVCLTSGTGGSAWHTNIYNIGNILATIDTTILGYPVSFDKETNILTTMSKSGTLTIRKYKLELSNLSLNAIPYTFNLVDEQVIEGTTSLFYVRDSGMDFWYTFESSSITGTKTEIKFKKLNKTTFEVSDVTLSLPSIELYSSFAMHLDFALWPGDAYLQAKSRDKIYKIDLSNSSNITTIEIPACGTANANNYHICPLDNNLLLCNGMIVDNNGGGYVVIDPDFNTGANKFYEFPADSYNGAALFNCFNGDGFKLYDTCNKGGNTSPRYLYIELDHTMLMSINNLETPVTKTADKTMKITYTLTYTN